MIDLEHIYAVVRHGSGRIDFETLQSLLLKNGIDFKEGEPLKRAVLEVCLSSSDAQSKAKEYRDELKQKKAAETKPSDAASGSTYPEPDRNCPDCKGTGMLDYGFTLGICTCCRKEQEE